MNLFSQKTFLLTKLVDFYRNHDKIIFYSITLSIIVLVIEAALVGFRYAGLPSQIPLFYSLPWGNSQLATTSQILILPTISILVLLTNLSVGWYLHDSQLILKRVLALTTLILSLLLLITTWGIVSIFT